MAEKKFNLETFMRAYLDFYKPKDYYISVYSRFWGRVMRLYLNPNSELLIDRDYDRNISEEEFLAEWGHKIPESVKPVIDMIKDAKGKPEAEEVRDTIVLVAKMNDEKYAREPQNLPYLQMFVNRLKKLEDKDLVYEELEQFKRAIDYKRPAEEVSEVKYAGRRPVYKDVATMMANNRNAKLSDIAEMIYFCETPDEAFKIINDVFARADEDLSAEMAKDVPNTDVVKSIIRYPRDVVDLAGHVYSGYRGEVCPEYLKAIERLNPQEKKIFVDTLTEWKRICRDKYDFDKIVGSGDADYVSSYEDTLEKQNVDLINENNRLKEDNKRLNQSNEQLRQNNSEKEEQISKLNNEIESLRSQLADEKVSKRRAEKTVQEFTDAAAKLEKAGVFERKKIIKDMVNIGVVEI